MDGIFATSHYRASATGRVVLRRMALSMCISLAVALCLLAGVLVGRRLSGGIVRPLSPAGIMAAAVVLTGLCAIERFACLRAGRWIAAGRTALLILAAATTTAALAIFAVLSLPGSSAGALTAAWTLFAVVECASWGLIWRRRGGRPVAPRADPPVRPDPPPPATSPPPLADEQAGLLPADVTRQVTRAVAEDGRDVLHGLFRANYQPGERTQNVHLVFCPPFDDRPALNAEQIEGPEATIKVAEVHTYGARLEVRLSSPSPVPATVTVEAYARGGVGRPSVPA